MELAQLIFVFFKRFRNSKLAKRIFTLCIRIYIDFTYYGIELYLEY